MELPRGRAKWSKHRNSKGWGSILKTPWNRKSWVGVWAGLKEKTLHEVNGFFLEPQKHVIDLKNCWKFNCSF